MNLINSNFNQTLNVLVRKTCLMAETWTCKGRWKNIWYSEFNISPETSDFCATLCRPYIFTLRVREGQRVYKLGESFMAKEKAKFHHKRKVYCTNLNHCSTRFSLLFQSVYNFWTYTISASNSGLFLRNMKISTTAILTNLIRQIKYFPQLYYLLHIRLCSNTATDNLLMRYSTAAKQLDRFYIKAFDPFPACLCNTEFS